MLEEQQIAIYFAAVAVGALVALALPGVSTLQGAINPALAVMLFATFLQVPLADFAKRWPTSAFLRLCSRRTSP